MIASIVLMLACYADTLDRFDQAKQEAARLYPEAAQRVLTMKASFGETPPHTDGETILETGRVTFNGRICEYPTVHRYSIAAHEIGHVIEAVYHPTSYISESLADYYGAKLMQQKERYELMQHFDKKCRGGAPDYCVLIINWGYGFTH